MTAREKIQGLTNAWYGFAVFAALISLLQNGLGFFSLVGAVIGLAFSLTITFFLGRGLLARSSLLRIILVCLAAVFGLLGVLAVAKLAWLVVTTWHLSMIWTLVLTVGSVLMNYRSFRVLTDSTVKAYFR
jgi:hypothetical protein